MRLFVLAANISVIHKECEKILLSYFIWGLCDNILEMKILTIRLTSAAEAERMETAGDALRAKQRAKLVAGGYVAPEAEGYDSGGAAYPEHKDECE